MTSYSSNVLATPNLLGFWMLGDAGGSTTFADSSSSGNAPILHGGITLGAAGLAVSDATKAATFDGSSGYASFATSSVFDIEFTQPWTIEAIINVAATSPNQEGALIAKQVDGSNYRGFCAGIFGTSLSNEFILECVLLTDATHGIYVKGSQVMNTGTTYHVLISYDGSGTAAGVALWVDGVVDTSPSIVFNNLGGATIRNTATANISARGAGTALYFPGTIQYLAFYGASSPDGLTSTQAGYEGNWPYNIKAAADYCIGLQGATPVSDPSVPNVIIDTDMAGDIDDMSDVHMMCALAMQGKLNLIGVVTSSSNADSASVVQSILNFWRLTTVPVYAYQGSGNTANGAANSDYTTQVALRFMAGDATNEGCIASSISGGGTLNQVGDVLTVPGGTVASGVLGRTTKLTISSVSSGAITGFSISDAGSYGTPPSGTITLPNLHGGTAATVTLTYTARRGNYTNALSGLRQLVSRHDNVYILGIGFATNFAALLASVASAGGDGLASGVSMIAGNVKALLWAAGFASSCTYGTTAEFNMNVDPVSANALVSGSPVWPTPIIQCGVETVVVNNNFTTGLADIKPPSGLNPTTNPMAYAYAEYQANGGTLDSNGARPFYSGLAILFLSEGMGGGHLYWGTIGGTETISASTGTNSNTNAGGTPPWSTLRKKISDAALVTYGETLLGELPEVITITTPGTQTAGASMTVVGTYAGMTPSALDFAFDSGSYGAAPSPTISGGNFSFTTFAPVGLGSHTISVRDHITDVVITSGSFIVNSGVAIAVTTPNGLVIEGQAFAISGTYTGLAPTGANVKVDSGSYATATGFSASGGNWSASITAPAFGSHTVTVQEANATSTTATSGSFMVSVAPDNAALIYSPYNWAVGGGLGAHH